MAAKVLMSFLNTLRPVVDAPDDDGVVGDAEVLKLLENRPGDVVEFRHAVRINADAGFSEGNKRFGYELTNF